MNNGCTLIMSYANLFLRMQKFINNVFLRELQKRDGKYTNSGAILFLIFSGAMLDYDACCSLREIHFLTK